MKKIIPTIKNQLREFQVTKIYKVNLLFYFLVVIQEEICSEKEVNEDEKNSP